ncbi:Crp/Fnr family transcriptional regulator [Paenibacillus sp. FJAT-27812]|uniref:Crp/Fnr family transcriptional regulator n=1 Tax=Paenibacillus sp. FJAT-27812 TaxID=1684143 RepID=UPI0006A76B17|nr:Crp/Fnr family transcriptional regulator [Paenibacillus sp. FJAT-27812]
MAVSINTLPNDRDIKQDTGVAAFFSEENFNKLKGIMHTKKVEVHGYLFQEGESAEYMYFVKKGRVKLTKTTDTGNKITLYLHHTGDMFGHITPFQPSVQAFSAEVIEDAEFGVIEQAELERLLLKNGDLAIEFMRWMGAMYRMTQAKFRDLLLYGKPGALCSLLIRMSNSYGIQQSSHIAINYKATNMDLAEMIGATRESVNRMLSDMRKAEVLDIISGTIVIKNMDYLRHTCRCELCPIEICRV